MALDALITFCLQNNSAHETILSFCGESIAELWIKLGKFNIDLLNSLPEVAKKEALAILKSKKAAWIEGAY